MGVGGAGVAVGGGGGGGFVGRGVAVGLGVGVLVGSGRGLGVRVGTGVGISVGFFSAGGNSESPATLLSKATGMASGLFGSGVGVKVGRKLMPEKPAALA